MAKDAFSEVTENCEKNMVSLDIRKWILDCYVKPILICGSGSWTISSQIEQRLQAKEVWVPLKDAKISWTHLMSNEEVLRRAETKCTLLMIIRKRQLEFSWEHYEEWVRRIDLDRKCRWKEK